MTNRPRLSRTFAGSCCVALIVAATAHLTAGQEPGAAGTDEQGYIRPLKVNPEISELQEDLGLKTVSFAIRCPPGHKASISLIGTDETGKVVKDTGLKVTGFHNPKAQEEWIVRLARIDPKALKEDYAGKVRWRLTCRSKGGSTASSERWDDDWLRARGSVGSGTDSGAAVESPDAGKNYEVWRREIFSTGNRTGPDDVLFRYRLLVKFTPLGPRDFDGFRMDSVKAADDM